MILPIQITSRNVDLSKENEDDIRAHAQKLELYYSPITSCRVLVEAPARHRQRGYPFHIRLDLTVPDGEIVVNREPSLYPKQQDIGDERRRKAMESRPELKHLKVAIKEVFVAARRRLQDHARRRRADVKTHEAAPQARVTDLFPRKRYGYIETPDGGEIYFHANSVVNQRFKDLKVGSKVTFTEEAGEKGPQASTVHLITKSGTRKTLPQRAKAGKRKTA